MAKNYLHPCQVRGGGRLDSGRFRPDLKARKMFDRCLHFSFIFKSVRNKVLYHRIQMDMAVVKRVYFDELTEEGLAGYKVII